MKTAEEYLKDFNTRYEQIDTKEQARLDTLSCIQTILDDAEAELKDAVRWLKAFMKD